MTTNFFEEWFKIANMDIESARFLVSMQPKPIEVICYHCQQSTEKYLKGFLAFSNQEIPKMHDLIYLNDLCVKVDESFKEIYEPCLRLTDFAVNIRYPYPLDLEEIDMYQAISDSEKIKEFVTIKIPS